MIEIWPLEAEVDGRKTGIKGLHRVNETALGTLDDKAFVKLRKTGALQLAYTQLMSMAQIIRFARLAQLKRQLAAQKLKIKPEEIFKMEPTDLIRFDN